ncbi:MAG TPA: SIMPL domain-containing protein, partial [Nitrospira sp.]|nr:SIMPL domain-containing protein [Nitrospira sp.]
MVMLVILLMAEMILPRAVQAHDEVPEKPAVTVTGHGQMSLAPDTAFVTVGIETTGKTVADAQRQNRLIMNKVVERLRALQIDNERIQTASFIVS